jgi:XRE family transcriptional regulator, aerobic/anaerobic benzoate catabolism transcriptional regulator
MVGDRFLAALGRRVRQVREERGFSMREAAQRSRLSLRFLGQVEKGQGNISIRNLAALARALGTTPAALLAGAGDGALPIVALLGLRGAGKSTIGRKLARRLRLPFVELDRRVEEAAGLTLGEIFALHGEDYYRRLEREALEVVLREDRPVVLATGGGIVNSPDTYALLKRQALTIWLRARPLDHWTRVVQQGDRRPMADRPQAMAELRRILAVREPLYAEAAHSVDTAGRAVEAVTEAAAAIVGAARA